MKKYEFFPCDFGCFLFCSCWSLFTVITRDLALALVSVFVLASGPREKNKFFSL